MNLKLSETINDMPASLVVRRGTKKRLETSCFRGIGNRLAGNLSRWRDCSELFADPLILRELVIDAGETLQTTYRSASVSIDYGSSVGWTGTDAIEKYTEEDLEDFQPNYQSTALRVLSNLINFTAPRTNLVTIIYETKIENDGCVIIIHSVYPGEDVGELYGNVSLREQVVFFEWNHPGEA